MVAEGGTTREVDGALGVLALPGRIEGHDLAVGSDLFTGKGDERSAAFADAVSVHGEPLRPNLAHMARAGDVRQQGYGRGRTR